MSRYNARMNVAVVIPTYNRAEYIEQTLDSVFAQTRPPVVVVVADDGSTDDTKARISAWAARTSHLVFYVVQTNAGAPAARNLGLARLNDRPDVDAVMFLDSDDALVPDALARLSDALIANPNAPLAYGRLRLMDANGTLGKLWEVEDADGDMYERLLRRNFICTTGCALVRRSALTQVGNWDADLPYVEDWDLWLRLAEQGPVVRVTNGGPVINYRVHENNQSKNVSKARAYEQQMFEKHLTRAEKTGNAERRAQIAAVVEDAKKRDELARAGGAAVAEARLSAKHRFLRRVLGGAGLAGLYAKIVPFSVRLKIRSLLGIDRWA